MEADQRELHAQDRLAIDGAFVRTQALLDEQSTMAARLAQRLTDDRALTESALVAQQQLLLQQDALQGQALAGALQQHSCRLRSWLSR